MNDAPIYDYQELVIEEMRKELINQEQYIGKLTEAYNIEIERLNKEIEKMKVIVQVVLQKKNLEKLDIDKLYEVALIIKEEQMINWEVLKSE